ncbi:MAG: polysaccharide pyruvyl transferase family protein [Candidatus Cloacimonadales bacterium]|nr:polysaccharide pyruvyl transferase family protein [Candidatus Cloacimonadales bacterium]
MKILNKLLPPKIEYIPTEIRSREKSNKKNFIIHHYCPHTFNAGDHFVILSIRKLLKKVLPEAVFIPKAVANNRGWGKPIGLRGENIRLSNQYADAVILGGSDQYHNWSPRIKSEEIQHLIPPLFFIGLGVSSKDINSAPYLKKEEFKKDILAANQKCALSSVRDELTQNFLAELGYKDSILTGCPALYLFDEKMKLRNKSKRVLLTFPYPLIHNRKREDTSSKFGILAQVMNLILKKLQEFKLEPVIVCHDDRDVPIAQKMFPDHSIFFSNYVSEYFQLFENASLVIGSRLHATILAGGMGLPFININLDQRGTGFSQTFGLQNWNLNYNDPDLSAKIIERLTQLHQGDLSGFKDFAEIKQHYRSEFLSFMKKTAEIIRGFRS